MLTPFEATQQPGIKRFIIPGSVSGASPLALTYQLPEQGAYRFHWSGYKNAPGDHATVTGVLHWYAGDGSHWDLGQATTLSTSSLSITGVAVSAPSTTGVVTVTATYTGGGSFPIYGQMLLEQIAGPLDEYRLGSL